jgi:hypothetical protein
MGAPCCRVVFSYSGKRVHSPAERTRRKPGQITRYAQTFGEPHGNEFFAGEHTAMLNRGKKRAAELGGAPRARSSRGSRPTRALLEACKHGVR